MFTNKLVNWLLNILIFNQTIHFYDVFKKKYKNTFYFDYNIKNKHNYQNMIAITLI